MNSQELTYSSHAIIRMQQRGINSQVVEFIFEHGFKSNTHQDVRYIFNCNKQKKLNRNILSQPLYRKFDKQITATALVVNNNHLITAYKIDKRIKN